MKNMKIKALTDGALCTALAVVFLALTVYMPGFSLISIAVSGIPLTYLGVRHGMRISALAFAASLLVFLVLTGDLLSLALIGVVNLLPGLVAGYAISRKASYHMALFAIGGAVLFGLMIQLLVVNASGGGNGIEKAIDASIDGAGQAMQALLENFAASGAFQNANPAAMVSGLLQQMRELIFLYLPSFVIGYAMVLGYVVMMAAVFILRRLRVCRVLYPPFSHFRAPRGMCYAAMLLFLVAAFSKDSTVYTAALKNLVALIYAYIGVCGFSLVDYKLGEKIPSGYVRAVIYAAVFFAAYVLMGFLIQIMIFLGLIDGLFDFRRLNKAGENHAEHK